jgi:hypothetical protein
MGWYPIETREPGSRRERTLAWRCTTDSRLVVRHCGHPTANRPYWIIFDGIDLLDVLGTFRLLAQAQTAALLYADKLPAGGTPGNTVTKENTHAARRTRRTLRRRYAKTRVHPGEPRQRDL